MEYLEIVVTFAVDEEINDWFNVSSSIRGIWGRALRRAYCYQRRLNCLDCSLKNCTYITIFEKKYGDYEQFHPYIISLLSLEKNRVTVSFKFFGWLCEHYDKLIISILRMEEGELILKGKRYPITVELLKDQKDNIIYIADNPSIKKPVVSKISFTPQLFGAACLHLSTPFRQKYSGHLMSRFIAPPFISNLHKRICFFNEHFTCNKMLLPQSIETEGLKVLKDETKWVENLRRSFSQKKTMSLGGLVGKVEFSGLNPDAAGILKLGELFHAGKQTTFGNGRYTIEKEW